MPASRRAPSAAARGRYRRSCTDGRTDAKTKQTKEAEGPQSHQDQGRGGQRKCSVLQVQKPTSAHWLDAGVLGKEGGRALSPPCRAEKAETFRGDGLPRSELVTEPKPAFFSPEAETGVRCPRTHRALPEWSLLTVPPAVMSDSGHPSKGSLCSLRHRTCLPPPTSVSRVTFVGGMSRALGSADACLPHMPMGVACLSDVTCRNQLSERRLCLRLGPCERSKRNRGDSRQPPVPKTRSEERAPSLSLWTPLTLAKIRRETEVRVGRASVVETDGVRIPTALTLASWPQASREDPEAAPAEALQPDGSFGKPHGVGVGAPQRAAQVTGRAGQVHAGRSTREAGKRPHL